MATNQAYSSVPDDTSPRDNGCSCFRCFCFGRDEGSGSHSHLLQERSLHEETWLVMKLKKLKEFSEVVAGPKWKNLIRKIGKLCNPRGYSKQSAAPQFQYSPESYALNFAGDVRDGEEDGVLLHSFSTRFAPHAGLLNDQQRRAGL